MVGGTRAEVEDVVGEVVEEVFDGEVPVDVPVGLDEEVVVSVALLGAVGGEGEGVEAGEDDVVAAEEEVVVVVAVVVGGGGGGLIDLDVGSGVLCAISENGLRWRTAVTDTHGGLVGTIE